LVREYSGYGGWFRRRRFEVSLAMTGFFFPSPSLRKKGGRLAAAGNFPTSIAL
jgi:hypothetical protein